jgi:hypothetical protein
VDTPTLLATPASDVVVTEPPGPGPGLGPGRGPGSTIRPGATVLYEFECHVTAVAHRRDKSKTAKKPETLLRKLELRGFIMGQKTGLEAGRAGHRLGSLGSLAELLSPNCSCSGSGDTGCSRQCGFFSSWIERARVDFVRQRHRSVH